MKGDNELRKATLNMKSDQDYFSISLSFLMILYDWNFSKLRKIARKPYHAFFCKNGENWNKTSCNVATKK